jgi:hypothetical protein
MNEEKSLLHPEHFKYTWINIGSYSTALGVEEETSAHILCECEALASLRHLHLGSFFLEPENIKSINLGATWNFSKVTGLP